MVERGVLPEECHAAVPHGVRSGHLITSTTNASGCLLFTSRQPQQAFKTSWRQAYIAGYEAPEIP